MGMGGLLRLAFALSLTVCSLDAEAAPTISSIVAPPAAALDNARIYEQASPAVVLIVTDDGVADLALIQVAETPEGVKPLSLAEGQGVQVGSDVHAIGHPTGQTWTYTRGFVSQIRRDYEWRTLGSGRHRATVIQTQTPINPGNSGGPLLDDALDIVGINSFKSDGEGLNFAVSAADVRAFLDRPGDRLAEAPSADDCEVEVVTHQRSKRTDGVDYLMDSDCDGEGDFVMVEPDDKGEPNLYLYDMDGNGEVDEVYVDDGRDGTFDYSLHDIDADGKADLRGYYRKGEDEPYRYEKVAKGRR